MSSFALCEIRANNCVHMTQTAHRSFGIHPSHNGLLPIHGLLPVVMARFGHVTHSVRRLLVINDSEHNREPSHSRLSQASKIDNFPVIFLLFYGLSGMCVPVEYTCITNVYQRSQGGTP